jgi:predicted small secreted protein
MIQSRKTIDAFVIVAALLIGLSGCQKKEGPVEQAGKKVDQATEKVGQEIEKAGSKIQDAAQGEKK